MHILIIITILALPLYLLRFTLFGVPLNALDVLLALTIVAWCGQRGHMFPWRIFFARHRMVVVAVSIICVGALLSTVANGNDSHSWGILKSWFVLPMLFGFVVYDCVQQDASCARKVLGALFFSALIVAVCALSFALRGVVTYDGRLAAFYLSPNHLAMFLVPAIFVGIFLRAEAAHSMRTVYAIGTALIVLTLFCTRSYAAWGATITSLIAMGLLQYRGNRTMVLRGGFFLCALLALVFFAEGQTQKLQDVLQGNERSSFASRVMIWRAAFVIGADHLFLGIGPGQFQEMYLAYQKHFPPYLEWAVPQPHNLFLAFWLQTGLVGLGGFFLLLFLWFRHMTRFFAEQKSPIVIGLLGVMLAILLHGLVDTPYWKNDLAVVWWVVIVLGWAINKSSLSEKKNN